MKKTGQIENEVAAAACLQTMSAIDYEPRKTVFEDARDQLRLRIRKGAGVRQGA